MPARQGIDSRAAAIFETLEIDSADRNVHEARHCLRVGAPDRAEKLLARAVDEVPDHIAAWALRDIAWRLLGDPRHHWLHGQDGLIRPMPLDFTDEQFDAVVLLLDRLHDMSNMPVGQSVREGSQTRGGLFDRHEPEIAILEASFARAVEAYREQLPPRDDAHPLLRHRDSPWRFAGSWSIRVFEGGRHTEHIHPLGIVSSAAYFVVPQGDEDDPQAGWLELGRPPPDLRLDMPPIVAIEPKPRAMRAVSKHALSRHATLHGRQAHDGGDRHPTGPPLMGDHWDRFWSGESASGGGCLPMRDDLVERVQRNAWHEFATQLPRGAKVIDLATGDGRVLAWIIDKRRDLKPVGIDRAKQLPPAPRGIRLRGGISIENTPFADASFDAATSQFGIEYGDVEAASAELLRLLRRGGRFRLLIHHSSGPIVRHNLARAEGLKWASRESGALDKAENFARARAVAALPTPASFRDLPGEARARFGSGSGAEEFSVALLQTLELSRGAPPREVLAAIVELRQSAADELARIAALAAAAADSAKAEHIAALLRRGGAAVETPSEIPQGAGSVPFAWIIDGVKG